MMTRKERFERALRCEEVDRIPFWVKIFGGSYRDFQEKQYQDMAELELADHLDLDHFTGGPVPVRCVNDGVTVKTERTNGRQATVTEMPGRVLRSVDAYDASSHSWHPIEFPIKNIDDLRAMRHRFEHNRYEFVPDEAEKAEERLEEVGDRGVVTSGIGISPIMQLIQHLIGPDRTYYFLADYPDDVEELMEVMHQDRLRHCRAVVEHSVYDYVVSVENTSTTLLSPTVFEKYPWRHLSEYAQIITEHGKSHVLHMCGKLKALLPKIDELGSCSIEAYSSPPVGDTTIADRAALSPHTSIIGGTCATLWLKSADEICAEVEQDLDEAGGIRGVVLTSAGVMPPAATIEKVKKVREFAKGLTWERFG